MTPPRGWRRAFAPCLLAACLAGIGCGPAVAEASGERSGWVTEPRRLVVMRDSVSISWRPFVRAVEEAGGHVAVVFPPDAAIVLGEGRVLADPRVARWIGASASGPVMAAPWTARSGSVRRAVRAWNAALELARSASQPSATALADSVIDPGDLLARTSDGHRAATLLDRPYGADSTNTSEYMAGEVGVGVWLLQAAGSVDDWTDDEEAQTLGGIVAGMEAWVRRGGAPARLTFVIDVHSRITLSGDPFADCAEWYSWAAEALASAGYQGDPFGVSGCYRFNNALRRRLDTDWAFAMFVVNSPTDYSGNCPGMTGTAWALGGGPYFFMLRFSTWAVNWSQYYAGTPMHEAGHMFGASDEYNGFLERGGYLDAPDSEGAACVMNDADTTRVCSATRDQLGWRDADGDGLIEPLDTMPFVSVSRLGADPVPVVRYQYEGVARVAAIPSRDPHNDPRKPPPSISVDRIRDVEARVDGGAWFEAAPQDGAFDGYVEGFTWDSPELSIGEHVVEFRAPTEFGSGVVASARDTVVVTGSSRRPGPSSPRVESAVPNPARGEVVLTVGIPDCQRSAVAIWDVRGREIAPLHDGVLCAGWHRITWDLTDSRGRRVPAGVYFVGVRTPEGRSSRKIVLLP